MAHNVNIAVRPTVTQKDIDVLHGIAASFIKIAAAWAEVAECFDKLERATERPKETDDEEP